MNDNTRTESVPSPPFESGQVWQLADSRLRIGLVGKRLVHYKLYKGLANTSPVFLSTQVALATFLQEQHAILLQEQVAVRPAVRNRPVPVRRKRASKAEPKAG